MSPPADNERDAIAEGPEFTKLVVCIALGGLFYYLVGFAYAKVSATALPELLLELWSAFPLLGRLLVNALTALATYWLIAAIVGLAIAATARHDYVFYGAVSTGVFLVLTATSDYDGWQAFVEVGPDFWLALRTDAVTNDPFGTLSRWLSLPVCAWLWGRLAFDDPIPADS